MICAQTFQFAHLSSVEYSSMSKGTLAPAHPVPAGADLMEKPITETWVTPIRRPVSTNSAACLVHIYPTGAQMGTRYALGEKALQICRGEDCEILIPDHSVSRKHCRVDTETGIVSVTDLGSTNGTF